MPVVLIFFAGVGVGGIGVAALIYLGRTPDQPKPAATQRAIARAARRNRADLRRVLPAREQGVRITRSP